MAEDPARWQVRPLCMSVLANMLFPVRCSDVRKNLSGGGRGGRWSRHFCVSAKLSPLPRDVGANLFVLANLRIFLRPAMQCATEQRGVAMLEMRASQGNIKATFVAGRGGLVVRGVSQRVAHATRRLEGDKRMKLPQGPYNVQ